MSFPIMTLTNATATGDLISGPGASTVLVNCMPVSCVGDAVTGAACTGTITSSASPTMTVGGRPVACMTSAVTGVNPTSGAPVSTVCSVTTNATDMV